MSRSPRFQSEDVDPAPLGKPLTFEFSKRTAKNRFLKAAMTERISSFTPADPSKSGIPSEELINLYRRWGETSIGVILSGNVMIDPLHVEAPGNAVVPRDAPFSGERFEAFTALAKDAESAGSLLIAQVSHPGRQVDQNIQPNPISASDVQLTKEMMGMKFAKPRAASQEDIDNVVEGFAHAAQYLEAAGWSGVELHAAHGYLLSQFLSQTTNLRNDKYGGSLENRSRIIIDIAQRIRQRTKPGFVLGIKLNSVEFQERGFQPEEARELCSLLEKNTFDFVELSGGTFEETGFVHKRESTKKREAFFVEFAEQITPALTKTKAYITGGFRTAGAMVHALDVVDGVGLGRPLTQEPRLVKDILEGKVKGSIRPAYSEDDFGTSVTASGLQIHQIGKDNEPLDMGNEDNVKAFQTAFATFISQVHQGIADLKSGVPGLLNAKQVPYGIIAD